MTHSMRKLKIERAPAPRGRQETIRILLVVLGVGVLTLWTYWQTLFFFSGQSQLQHASNGSIIMLRTVVPLWLACFFPALSLGLGLYTFTHRMPRNIFLSRVRQKPDHLTEAQSYMVLCTAICLFSVNYRILPIFPLVSGGLDQAGDMVIMTVVKQQAFIGILGMIVVFLQGWLVIRKKGGSRRNLLVLTASLSAVGLLIPWSGCLDLMMRPTL